jgi:hypothetical protein
VFPDYLRRLPYVFTQHETRITHRFPNFAL